MKILFLLISLIIGFSLFGQNEIWISAKGKIGFLAAHRANIGHLATEHAFATEITLEKQSKGEKAWQKAYGMPRYGVTAFVGTVGNRELLGHYFGAFGFMTFPMINQEKFTLAAKVGSGLGYGTKVYDPDNNILSSAVSTHFNAMISMGLDARLVLGNNSFVLGIDMTHFSNAAYQVPNLGLNIPYLSIGYGRKIKESSIDTSIHHKTFQKYWEFGGVAIASVKEIFPTEGKKYPVFGLNAIARRYFKQTVGMELSFDFIYKQAIYAYQADVPKTDAEIIQLGIFAGYLVPLNHLHLVVGMGYYVKDKYQPEDAFYHRVGMRYVFDNGLNLNLVLKSHWARADYAEFGIGYTIRR